MDRVPPVASANGVGGEDAGGDRDERERHRERLEVAERAGELLAVAEPVQFLVLGDASRGDLVHVMLLLPPGDDPPVTPRSGGTARPPRPPWGPPSGARITVQPAAVSASMASAIGVGVGEDRGDAAQRADPVHGDRAELARVGQDVGGGRVRDDRAPGGHLGRVVVGQPGLRVHAAGAEERLVGVEVGEEGLGLRAEAGRVAVPDLPAAQQQLDLLPVGERHRGGHRVRQHPAAEGFRAAPGPPRARWCRCR